MTEGTKRLRKPDVFDYRALRLSVGVIALMLPIALPAGAGHFSLAEVLSSISAYYHSGMRNLFVASLCVIATFLFAYNGRALREAVASRIACLFALAVAFFPTPPASQPLTDFAQVAGAIHAIAAVGLFAILAVFCLVFFQARFRGRVLTRKEWRRQTVYRVCGAVIVTCILAIGVAYLPALDAWRARAKPVFLLEQLALGAFALSWFTAGKWAAIPYLVDESDAYHIRPV